MYIVTNYGCELKEFTVKYQNRMIKEDDVDWVSQDDNHAKMEHVKTNMIQDRIELQKREEGRVKEHNRDKE